MDGRHRRRCSPASSSQAARARLAPGGVLCQWAHTYDISAEDLRSIVGTFASVFPDGTMWLVGDGDVLLVGGDRAAGAAGGGPARGLGRPARGRRRPGRRGRPRPVQRWSRCWSPRGRAWPASPAGARLHDRRLRAGRVHRARAPSSRAAAPTTPPRCAPWPPSNRCRSVEAARAAASAASWRDRGLDAPRRQRPAGRPGPTSRPRSAPDPHDARALEGLVRAGRRGQPAVGDGWRCCASWPRRPTTSRRRSPCRASWPRPAPSRRRPRVAFAAAERHPSRRRRPRAAGVGAGRRRRPRAAAAGGGADCELSRPPPTPRATTRRPCSSSTAAPIWPSPRPGRWSRPTRRTPEAHNLLGAALATAGRREEARDAFLASLKVEPRDPSTYTNLALLELESGNRAAGLQRLAEALLARSRPPTARARPTRASRRPRRRALRRRARRARAVSNSSKVDPRARSHRRAIVRSAASAVPVALDQLRPNSIRA